MDSETKLTDGPASVLEKEKAKPTLIDVLIHPGTTPDPDVLAQVLRRFRQLQSERSHEFCQALQILADRSRWGQQRDCSSLSVN